MIECLTMQIGDKIYKFNDVAVSNNSTSLNDIVKALAKSPRYQNIIEDILNTENVTQINDIIDYKTSDPDINTYIGDNAIGNISGKGLVSLMNSSGVYGSKIVNALLQSDASKIDDYGFNFLVSNSVTTPKIFVGQTRNFVVLNPVNITQQETMTGLFAYLFADSELKNPNSSIYKTILEYARDISSKDTDLARELQLLNDSNKAKRLLIYSQDESIVSKNPALRGMLAKIATDISGKIDLGVEAATLKKLSNYDKLKREIIQAGTTVLVNDNKYDIEVVDTLTRDLDTFKTDEPLNAADIAEKFDIDVTLLPNNRHQLAYINENYTTNELLQNVLNLTDALEISKLKQLGIINYLNTQIFNSIPDDIENVSYTPKAVDIEIDPTLTVTDRSAIQIQTNQELFSKKGVELVLDFNQSEFIRVVNSSRGTNPPKFIINPDIAATISDKVMAKEINIHMTKFTKTGKIKKSNSSIRNMIFVRPNSQYTSTPERAQNIARLFELLNTNYVRLNTLHTTGYDDLAFDVMKAGLQNRIRNSVFPTIYNWKRDGYNKGNKDNFLKDLTILDSPVISIKNNFTYKFSDDFKSKADSRFANQDNVSQLNLLREGKIDTIPVLYSSDILNKQIGSIINIVNAETGYSTKMQLTGISQFRFQDTYSNWSDFYEDGDYKLGTVFNYNGEQMVLINRTEEGYVLTNGKITNIVTDLAKRIGQENSPLYLSDSKIIGDDVYFYNNLGLIKNGSRTVYKDDYYDYFNDEIQDMSYRTGFSVNHIKRNLLKNITQFKDIRLVSFKRYTPTKYNEITATPDNYSNINMLDILARKVTRSGVKVNILPTSEIAKIGEGLTNHNAFIYEGQIYLNEDLATEDSLIHELSHLLLGDLKVNNPRAYRTLLDQSTELPGFNELRTAYKELSEYDYAEEVLVHNFTDFFLGKLRYWGDFSKSIEGISWKSLFQRLFNLEVPISDSDTVYKIMQDTLSNLVLNNSSNLLNQLKIKYDNTPVIIDRRVSNIKSKLISNLSINEDNNLNIECE